MILKIQFQLQVAKQVPRQQCKPVWKNICTKFPVVSAVNECNDVPREACDKVPKYVKAHSCFLLTNFNHKIYQYFSWL